jgi:glycosyltransferase involved in cell wall biosynthesis
MRILMLTQFYPPIVGGEEQYVTNLSRELSARGHQVAVATLWQEGLAEFEMDRQVRVYRIRSTMQRAGWLFRDTERRHAPPFPDPQAVRALAKVVSLEKPEIVHAHNWLVHSFLPLKTWSGAKLVVSLHDYSFLCAKKRLTYQGAVCDGPAFTKCLSCARNHYGAVKGIVTVVSNCAMRAVERALVDMFLPVSKATAAGNGLLDSQLPHQVIPNFVTGEIGADSKPADPRLAKLPTEDFLLFVGDLSRDKGVHVLLRAYSRIMNAPPLVLIGRTIGDVPTDSHRNVFCLGSWPHAAVVQAWHRCRIAFAPSTWLEPFGMVVIEAMAASRPVIASRSGGLADIVVDGETGYLVPPGDVSALRQAIERLLADPQLAMRMGQAGKKRVAEFHASAVVPRIERVYQTLTERGREVKVIKPHSEAV